MGEERAVNVGFDEEAATQLADDLDRQVPLTPTGGIRVDSARAAGLLRAAVEQVRLLHLLVRKAEADLVIQKGNVCYWAERALAAESLLAETREHLEAREHRLRSLRAGRSS